MSTAPVATSASQSAISAEIAAVHATAPAGETQPRLDFAPYRSSLLRHPTKALQQADPEGVELLAPGLRALRRRTRSRPT